MRPRLIWGTFLPGELPRILFALAGALLCVLSLFFLDEIAGWLLR